MSNGANTYESNTELILTMDLLCHLTILAGKYYFTDICPFCQNLYEIFLHK